MSVTFSTNAPATGNTVNEPCMCAQGSEHFCDAMDGDLCFAVRASLHEHANDACLVCSGTGVEEREVFDDFNLCNANARCVLGLLGLDAVELCGGCTVPEARRAVMVARATFGRRAGGFTRASATEHGAPRENSDGTFELRPLRSHSFGLDMAGLESRVEIFAGLVERSAAEGATEVMWF